MPDTIAASWQPLFGLSGVTTIARNAGPITLALGLTASPDGAQRWHGVLTVEGVRTTDHRELGADSTTWRDLPLPLTMHNCGPHGSPGPAPVCGAIETIARDGNQITATGFFDTGPDGTEAARLVSEGILRWVSVDLEVLSSVVIEVTTSGASYDSDGDDDSPDWWERVTSGRIAGAALCPVPAFPQAVIAMEGKPLPTVTPDNGLATVASGAPAIPVVPPAEWFDDPQLSGPTRLTITDAGQVYGHVAAWGIAHIGLPVPTYAPRSKTGYAHFLRGSTEVTTADGTARIATGVLTMDTGHAAKTLGQADTVNHYDHTGTTAATFRLGEDAHGIWMAGAVLPSVTEEQVRLLRAVGSVSGDWRRIGGNMELVAVLAVNVPGFPVPSALVASGVPLLLPTEIGAQVGMLGDEMVSLVAAGIVAPDPVGEQLRAIRREVSTMRSMLDLQRPAVVESLAARFGPISDANTLAPEIVDVAAAKAKDRMIAAFAAREEDARVRSSLRDEMSSRLAAFLPAKP